MVYFFVADFVRVWTTLAAAVAFILSVPGMAADLACHPVHCLWVMGWLLSYFYITDWKWNSAAIVKVALCLILSHAIDSDRLIPSDFPNLRIVADVACDLARALSKAAWFPLFFHGFLLYRQHRGKVGRVASLRRWLAGLRLSPLGGPDTSPAVGPDPRLRPGS